jgi:2-dehydro-3-deoxygluconokinase
MAQVVTLGEIMLRLNPPGFQRFLQASTFEISYGGAEASVATSLANFGASSSFVTCLPSSEIGQAAINYVRRFGVDTSYIIRSGERIGVYFLEIGANQRPSKVIYDRAHSVVHSHNIERTDQGSSLGRLFWTWHVPRFGQL